MVNFIKYFYLKFYPKPFGIKNFGARSLVMFPRRVHGGKSITIGADTIIAERGWLAAYHSYAGIDQNPLITIGSGVRIGPGFMLTAINEIEIGNDCLLSAQVFISDHTHGFTPSEVSPSKQPLVNGGPVKIGKNCFIGIRVAILPGVSLGDYTVVGAHSVVTKSFPPGSVIAGAPAVLLRTLPLPG